MYIDLRCSECGDHSRVLFSTLYEVWVEGYRAMDKEYRAKAKAITNIRCHCGHNEKYDGPMFSYIFQLIFDEFVKKEEV